MEKELTHKKIYLVFIPAILLGCLALFIQIIQYEPLFPAQQPDTETENQVVAIELRPDDPIIGNKRAPRTIVAFEDFACGECKRQHEIFTELQKQFPDKV